MYGYPVSGAASVTLCTDIQLVGQYNVTEAAPLTGYPYTMLQKLPHQLDIHTSVTLYMDIQLVGQLL